MVQRQAGKPIALILFPAFLACSTVAQDAVSDTYVTWRIFEPDKCASVWLIKRHIDPRARFVFFAREQEVPQGIAFDTPDARFRRYFNKSTYETLLEHHRLSDERLVDIGRIMHDIEVNVWERKALAETSRVQSEIVRILSEDDPEKNVDACLTYFDNFYPSP